MNIDDLMGDESFWNWANNSDAEDCAKWEQYFREHPEEADTLLRARLLALDHPRPQEHDLSMDEQWSIIESSIGTHQKGITRRKVLGLAGIAASVLILITLGLMSIDRQTTEMPMLTLATAPGEVSEVHLSDGTHITLNGNSELLYPQTFTADMPREVWLKGEAFFDVAPVNGSTFTVSTPNADTRVLGTQFNVRARPGSKEIISLLEGKVQIEASHSTGKAVLTPGYSAIVNVEAIEVLRDDVEDRLSWREYMWTFNNTPLYEVLDELEDTFGVTATPGSDIDMEKAISGKLSTRNLATLYNALEVMLGVEITNTGEGIKINKKG